MMQVHTTKRFDSQFKKQNQKTQKSFQQRIQIFLEDQRNPILKIHKLSGEYKGLWSFNVNADIRVIFDKSRLEKDSVILLVSIGSHSELYS